MNYHLVKLIHNYALGTCEETILLESNKKYPLNIALQYYLENTLGGIFIEKDTELPKITKYWETSGASITISSIEEPTGEALPYLLHHLTIVELEEECIQESLNEEEIEVLTLEEMMDK